MTFEDARQIALALPEVVESTSYGTPSFKVGRRFLARLRPELDALVVRIDISDREYLLAHEPDLYFSTPHYDGYPVVLVRLGPLRPAELRRLLEASLRFGTPVALRPRP